MTTQHSQTLGNDQTGIRLGALDKHHRIRAPLLAVLSLIVLWTCVIFVLHGLLDYVVWVWNLWPPF